MFLLVTIVGVGYAYAELINGRLGPKDGLRWLLLLPVWVVYVVVLLTADMTDVWTQAVQSFAIASFVGTVFGLRRSGRCRRRLGRAR